MYGQADLFQIVGALDSCSGFTHLLHGGKQQADQDCNDGDNHQQFNQRECLTSRCSHGNPPMNRYRVHRTRTSMENDSERNANCLRRGGGTSIVRPKISASTKLSRKGGFDEESLSRPFQVGNRVGAEVWEKKS